MPQAEVCGYICSLPFAADQLIGNMAAAINRAQRLGDGLRTDRNRAGVRLRENEIPHERLDVAVEDEADDFALAIDDGAARVAADDVIGADEVEGRLHVDVLLVLEPATGQVVGRLVVVRLGTLVSAFDVRLEG